MLYGHNPASTSWPELQPCKPLPVVCAKPLLRICPCLCAVKIGDRIAQLVLERIVTPSVLVVDSLESTDRGAGGFGSTGVSS